MQTLQVNTTLDVRDIQINPEYARAVPSLTDDEYAKLKNSIQKDGLYEPIIINKEYVILDGHHRFKACKELEVTPRYTVKHFENQLQERKYVIATNLYRRQLTSFQKVELAEPLIAIERELAKLRMLKGDPRQNFAEGKALERVAEDIGVSHETIRQALYVKENAPKEVVDRVRAGKKSISGAYRELKKKEKISELRQEIPEIPDPEGVFGVIVVDPPWPYRLTGNNEYDSEGNRADSPYPEMSLEEIKNIELPCDDDCVLWLWTTNRFMHEAYHCLEAWGFEPKTILTWVKDRMGLGRWLRSQTEHCILAVKGSPLVDLVNETTVLEAPNRGHSTKPDEFYELVDRLCVGTKIDWFSRKSRPGWAGYGTMEEDD